MCSLYPGAEDPKGPENTGNNPNFNDANLSNYNSPQQQQPPPTHGPWFGPTIAAPQASHPTAPPPLTQQLTMPRATPPATGQQEEWDDAYLSVLGSQDPRQLRELLARSNPEIVMPLNGPTPLSQAVVLTLIHRVRHSPLPSVSGTSTDYLI